MVDKDILQRKLSFIDRRLLNLETLKLLPREEFLANFQSVDSAKYNFKFVLRP